VAFIEWNPRFSVGVAELDQQHQKLVELTNRLHSSMLAGKSSSVLGPILQQLVAYTRGHFAREEQLMQQAGFPGYEAHKRQHELLTAQVVKFVEEMNAKKLGVSIHVVQFLKEWLLGHIQGADQAYAGHMAAKGIR
jgi:hemerythrin-like metal-binding protein